MYNKDAQNIAKLYVEFTLNEPSDEEETEEFAKEIEAILLKTMLGKNLPFIYTGETPSTDGEIEALSVAGQPLKDYQIKNIAYAFANGSIGHEAADEEREKYAQYVSDKIIKLLMKKTMNNPNDLGGKLTQDYYKPVHDPNEFNPFKKKAPRFTGDNEGGVL